MNEIKNITVVFEKFGLTHKAVFSFVEPNACGLITNSNGNLTQEDNKIVLMNATPAQLIQEVKDRFDVVLPIVTGFM